MAYTVKKLAGLSGVSVRTLHFYDEIGLLAPAFVADNGYRYYEEEQVLNLQQILFFRELGFELKQIQQILNQVDFDKVKALLTHKEALTRKGKHIAELINTIDQTIKRLKGDNTMKNNNQLFYGFSNEEQDAYEDYLVNRYGDDALLSIKEAKAKNHTQKEQEAFFMEWESILTDLANLFKTGLEPSSAQVQAVIKRHYQFLHNFWTPNKDSYIGVTLGYTDFAWKKAFEKVDDHHPRIAQYFAKAAKIFAERNL